MDAWRRSARLNPPEPPDHSYVTARTGESPESGASADKIAARPSGSPAASSHQLVVDHLGADITPSSGKIKTILITDTHTKLSYENLSKGTSSKLIGT